MPQADQRYQGKRGKFKRMAERLTEERRRRKKKKKKKKKKHNDLVKKKEKKKTVDHQEATLLHPVL